jgi:hypothetical protein
VTERVEDLLWSAWMPREEAVVKAASATRQQGSVGNETPFLGPVARMKLVRMKL